MKKHLLCFTFALSMFSVMQAQTNILNNGGFDTDGVLGGGTSDQWGMWSGNGGVAEVIGGVLTCTTVAAADNWFFSVEQWYYEVENGITYTVSFDAWADVDRKIAVTLEDPANAYNQLGISPNPGTPNGRSKWDVNITTTKTTYYLLLTVDAILETTTTKFAFLLAQKNGMVYIDNVSLVEGDVSVSATKSTSLAFYPNPANNEVYINGVANSEINVYSITGKLLVTNFATSQEHKLDVSGLVPGIYMLKVGNRAERLIIK